MRIWLSLKTVAIHIAVALSEIFRYSNRVVAVVRVDVHSEFCAIVQCELEENKRSLGSEWSLSAGVGDQPQHYPPKPRLVRTRPRG